MSPSSAFDGEEMIQTITARKMLVTAHAGDGHGQAAMRRVKEQMDKEYGTTSTHSQGPVKGQERVLDKRADYDGDVQRVVDLVCCFSLSTWSTRSVSTEPMFRDHL